MKAERSTSTSGFEGLVFTDVAYRYPGSDGLVLKDVTFSAEPGTLVACLGRSGSGKTTLLRLAAGLDVPADGDVRLWGTPPTLLPPRERDVGFVGQEVSVYGHLSVFENVSLPMKHRVGARDHTEKIDLILAATGIRDLGSRRVDSLSGGERQRVALARILGWSPRLLCLDEPLASVDAAARGDLLRLIQDTHKRLGSVSLFVTHAASESLAIADRVLVLDHGRQLQYASAEEVFRNPAHLEVFRLLADGPPTLLRGHLEAAPTALGEFRLRVGAEGVICGTITEARSPSHVQEIIVALLPRDLRIAEATNGQAGMVEGVVRRIQYAGTGYVLDCETRLGVMYAGTDHRRADDERVIVDLRGQSVPMFSAADGMRIATATLRGYETC